MDSDIRRVQSSELGGEEDVPAGGRLAAGGGKRGSLDPRSPHETQNPGATSGSETGTFHHIK